jgi:hypothetical protein
MNAKYIFLKSLPTSLYKREEKTFVIYERIENNFPLFLKGVRGIF